MVVNEKCLNEEYYITNTDSVVYRLDMDRKTMKCFLPKERGSTWMNDERDFRIIRWTLITYCRKLTYKEYFEYISPSGD